MRSKVAVAILLVAMAVSPMAWADDCTVTTTIPEDCTPGAIISLDIVLVPVNGGDSIATTVTGQSVVPGEAVVAEATGLNVREDYEAHCLALVTYLDGDTELCQWSCMVLAKWFNCDDAECTANRHE